MPTAGRPLATSRFESLYAEPFGRWKPANCSRSVSNKLGGAGRDGDCCSEDLDGKKDGTQKRATISTQKRATISRELSKLMVTLVAHLDATDDRERLAATRTLTCGVLDMWRRNSIPALATCADHLLEGSSLSSSPDFGSSRHRTRP